MGLADCFLELQLKSRVDVVVYFARDFRRVVGVDSPFGRYVVAYARAEDSRVSVHLPAADSELAACRHCRADIVAVVAEFVCVEHSARYRKAVGQDVGGLQPHKRFYARVVVRFHAQAFRAALFVERRIHQEVRVCADCRLDVEFRVGERLYRISDAREYAREV